MPSRLLLHSRHSLYCEPLKSSPRAKIFMPPRDPVAGEPTAATPVWLRPAALWSRLLLWGRLSSLRPAFQPAWVPFTDCHSCAQSHLPPSGACRQACRAGGHAGRATQSRAAREFQSPSGPHDCALHLQPPSRVGAAHRVRPLSSHLRVLRVLRGLFSPGSPCSLWFAFSVPSASVPSPPPVTTLPKSFSLSFSTTSQFPLPSPLAPILYVESERCG